VHQDDGPEQTTHSTGIDDGGCRRAVERDGTCEPTFREVARRFCASREEHDLLFSAGDLGADKRGALNRVVRSGAMEEVGSNRGFLETGCFLGSLCN